MIQWFLNCALQISEALTRGGAKNTVLGPTTTSTKIDHSDTLYFVRILFK